MAGGGQRPWPPLLYPPSPPRIRKAKEGAWAEAGTTVVPTPIPVARRLGELLEEEDDLGGSGKELLGPH